MLLPDGAKVCSKCVRLLQFFGQAARKKEAFVSSFASLHKKAFPLKRPASPSEEEKRSRARLSGNPTGATVSFTSATTTSAKNYRRKYRSIRILKAV